MEEEQPKPESTTVDGDDEKYPLVYKIIVNGGTFNFTFQTGSQVILQTGHPVPFPKT